MSAFSAGTTAFAVQASERQSESIAAAVGVDDDDKKKAIAAAVAPSKEDGLSTIIKWVPGEVIGTYAAVVAALIATSEGHADRATGAEGWLLVIFMCSALLITVLGGYLVFRKVKVSGPMPGEQRVELLVRGLLSAIGLLIWSCVIPGTVSNRSDLLTTYEGAASAMVLFVAVIFGLLAEWMVLPVTIRSIRRRLGG